MFDNARWIAKKNTHGINTYAGFFKSFDLKEKVKHATVQISAHNHFKLFVNKQQVSGIVTPAPSVANHRKLYLTYDITPHLKIGKNLFEVITLYLGGSGQNYVNTHPGMIFQAVITLEEVNYIISSDTTWKTYDHIPYIDHAPFRENRKVSVVEHYDARIKPNESAATEAVLSKLETMNIILDLQKIKEGEVHTTLVPRCIHTSKEVTVFDLGRIATASIKFTLAGHKDHRLIFRYSEDLEGHRVKHNVANEVSENYTDVYIMDDTAIQSHIADFTYKSFRYFEIEGYGEPIDENSLEVVIASTGIKRIGSVYSKSYPILNKLFDVAIRTHLNNTQGLLSDCPHREQAQYLGDSLLQYETLATNFTGTIELIEKVLLDFKDIRTVHGTFPYVAPTNYEEPTHQLRITEYDLYYMMLLHSLYELTSDAKRIEPYISVAMEIIRQYASQIDNTGLIKKDDGWHISDWPYPSVDHESDYLTVQNLLFIQALDALMKLPNSTLLPREELQAIKTEHVKNVREKLMSNGLLVDCLGSLNKHQGVNALGVQAGVFKNEEIDHVLNHIVSMNFSSSVILGRSVLRTLFDHRRTEDALAYIFDHDKGWGTMLRAGANTLWEGFDDIESHSHAWNSYPVRMVQEYLAGIKIKSINQGQIDLHPQFASRINDIEATIITSKGIVSFGYIIKKEYICFRGTLPEGLNATLHYKNQTINLINTRIDVVLPYLEG
jgi:alpha-L-rhamnosidase